MREVVNNMSGNKVVLCTLDSFYYKVNVKKMDDATTIHADRWNEFLFDYNLFEDDKILFTIRNNMFHVIGMSKDNLAKTRSAFAGL